MTNHDLAADYIERARLRLGALQWLYDNGAHADVVREAQEALELILKGYLRRIKIDPPKWHDVGSILLENRDRLHQEVVDHLSEICLLSTQLRKERENSYYGDDDLIPSKSYSQTDAQGFLLRTQSIYEIFKDLI